RAMGTVKLLELVLELPEPVQVIKGSGSEDEAAGELGPDLAEVGAAVLAQRLLVVGAEVVVGPLAAGEADEGAFAGQVTSPGQVKERRHELAMGQVARRTEENDCAGLGHPGPRKRLTQRIGIGHA